MCDALSRSEVAEKSYGQENNRTNAPISLIACPQSTLSEIGTSVRLGPETNLDYVCYLTLTLEKRPWFKIMTDHWVMGNNVSSIIHDPS